MVENLSDLTYVNLMRSTSQDDTLSRKAALERWADKFGVKANIYNEVNDRFSEQSFKSATEYSKQKIKFVGLYIIIKIPSLKYKFNL